MEKTSKQSKIIKEINPLVLLGIVILANITSYTVFMLSLGVKLTFFGIVADFLFIITIFVLLNLIPGSMPRKIAYAVATLLINIILIADITYFFQFKAFASITSVPLVGNVVGQNFGIKIPWPGIIIIVLYMLFAASLFLLRLKNLEKWDRLLVKMGLLLSLTVVMLSVNLPSVIINSKAAEEYSYDESEYIHSSSYLYNELYSSYKFVENFGYYTFRVRDIFYEPKTYISREEQIENFFAARETAKNTNSMTDALKGDNLITILGETFDQRFTDPDFIGARLNSLGPAAHINPKSPLPDQEAGHIFAKTLSPHLYDLRESAYVFDNYYVPTFFEGATINTEFMALNGIYALSARNFTSSVGNYYYTNYFGDYSLPGQLKANGYDTYFMHNDSNAFYNRGVLMYNHGFDTLLFDEDLKNAGSTTEKVYDTRLLEFIDLLEDDLISGGKFYLHMDTYSMHTGNDIKFQKHLPKVENAFILAGINPKAVDRQLVNYYCKVVEFDNFLGLLFDRLEELGLKDNTAVLLFPDHYFYTLDPMLMERFLGINPRTSYEIHKNKLFLVSSKLPATRDNTLASSIDIAPTLLNMLLGKDANYKYFMGADIFDPTDKIVSFSDLTVFDGQIYLNADGTYIENGFIARGAIDHRINKLTDLQVEIVKKYEVAKALLMTDFFYYLNPNGQKAPVETPPPKL